MLGSSTGSRKSRTSHASGSAPRVPEGRSHGRCYERPLRQEVPRLDHVGAVPVASWSQETPAVRVRPGAASRQLAAQSVRSPCHVSPSGRRRQTRSAAVALGARPDAAVTARTVPRSASGPCSGASSRSSPRSRSGGQSTSCAACLRIACHPRRPTERRAAPATPHPVVHTGRSRSPSGIRAIAGEPGLSTSARCAGAARRVGNDERVERARGAGVMSSPRCPFWHRCARWRAGGL